MFTNESKVTVKMCATTAGDDGLPTRIWSLSPSTYYQRKMFVAKKQNEPNTYTHSHICTGKKKERQRNSSGEKIRKN